VVPATVTDDADIHVWLDVFMRVVRAIAAACKAEPALNVWYNADLAERRVIKRVDLGMRSIPKVVLSSRCCAIAASATPSTCEVGSIACELMRSRGRSRRKSSEAQRFRFRTLVGSEDASQTLLLFRPKLPSWVSAALGNRSYRTTVKPSIRHMLPLSFTFDHCVMTGGEAARFLVALKRDLEART
jgi:2-oxoisovalerate dehydrogenase E2 component (dihydrolipoyl transacylase)